MQNNKSTAVTATGVVLTYGTFDLFHVGHLKILQRAKNMGEHLVVGVSTDEFNLGKGKRTVIPFSQRLEIVQNIKCVDVAFAEEDWKQKCSDIEKYKVQTFVMGDDWTGKFDSLEKYCDVKYLTRTQGVSSTSLKEMLKNLVQISPDKLKESIFLLQQILRNFE